jgi:hypothetical protein
VDVIAAAPAPVWEIDAHCYSDEAWQAIRQLDRQIRSAFGHLNGVSDTLATKVLLGVFGNVPAFDTFFRAGFRAATFGPKAFRRIGQFYREHADIIDRNRHTPRLLSGDTCRPGATRIPGRCRGHRRDHGRGAPQRGSLPDSPRWGTFSASRIPV